ncbi:MAG: hypothetical protein NVSMB30_28130 [Hymenobacter sp.]
MVATGGGTPCVHHNLEVLAATGLMLWLAVPVPVLAARLAATAEKASRPLLATAGPSEKWLTETLSAREQFYGQARLRWSEDAGSLSVLAARLAAAGFVPPPAESPARA